MASSPDLHFDERITPAKFREKIWKFHFSGFALKFMKTLTNQKFQNVARILLFFFNVSYPKVGLQRNTENWVI